MSEEFEVPFGVGSQKWHPYYDYLLEHYQIAVSYAGSKYTKLDSSKVKRTIEFKTRYELYPGYESHLYIERTGDKDNDRYKCYTRKYINYTIKVGLLNKIHVISSIKVDSKLRTVKFKLDTVNESIIDEILKQIDWPKLYDYDGELLFKLPPEEDKRKSNSSNSNSGYSKMLDKLTNYTPNNVYISSEMRKRLLQLCHPDKNSNTESAKVATQWLLSLDIK